jgi:hypothetical protein
VSNVILLFAAQLEHHGRGGFDSDAVGVSPSSGCTLLLLFSFSTIAISSWARLGFLSRANNTAKL